MHSSYVFFTGSACGLLLLISARLLISYRHQPAGRWLIVMLAGVLCYLLWPLLSLEHPLVKLLFDLPTILVPAAFWLFAHQLCSEEDDFPRWGWVPIGLSIVVPSAANHLNFATTPALHGALYVLAQPLKLGLIAAGMVELFRHFQSDLVEARRRLRAVLLIAVGGYMLVVVSAEFLFTYWPVPAGIPTLHALLATLLTFAACLWLLALSPGALGESLPPAPEESSTPTEETPAPAAQPLDTAQQQLLEQLQAHMRAGGYRHTGLTIRELAEQLGAREHVLRSLINRHLGYRNFNEYLNEFRIDEASARLADPGQSHLPVLSIALDIGYRSLSPFNAAFKRRHNCTPTEYRREQLPA
ncbi:AraC family transcriptional regulator [Microbulbifer flavimaris]|uniref:AraC family transcriptional regulator n=1 Tax=Microbulbifer flavimaris TaxID=1781068 RepID=A0ABX4HYI9_9GAMM|nr:MULTISPECIES: helix-turn-helix transcriptional regulator [Microbulbifer]KUJ82562.1 AraC family transcriptional regulator [Microbulbifer sp. ZGT114]PCO04772.1 AraC family transcriptional regulator [Microbulbifer flavimaris]